MKKLEGLQWSPRWVSHLGCIRGCVDYLGLEISTAWLYGGTGHAFVINVHDGVCPSGPTAWNTSQISALGKNLGYELACVFGHKNAPDFQEAQERAWEQTRQAIDEGTPCYGWELEIPEFYVIQGYDEVGYYYSGPGCDEGKGPKPWQEVGDTGIGMLEMYAVRPDQAADDATTVREALRFVLNIAGNPKEWIMAKYRAGLEGYDNWIGALRDGGASDMGARYNAGVWAECRRHAVAFLQEAQGRVDGPFAPAIAAYRSVSAALDRVTELYPWAHGVSDEDLLPIDERSQAAVEALQAAREAEAAGLEALGGIVEALS